MCTPISHFVRAAIACALAALSLDTFAKPQLLGAHDRPAQANGRGLRTQGQPVRLNKQELKALRHREEFEFTLPNGKRHDFVLELAQDHGDGIESFVGAHKERGNHNRVVITTGPGGTFGLLSTPDGDYRLVPGDGHDWLVDARAEAAEHPPVVLGIDARIPPLPKRGETALRHPPETLIALEGVNTLPISKAMPSPLYVIDLMMVYTPGLKARLGTALLTRLHNLVISANTAYTDSEVAITLRLVHAMEVNASDNTSDEVALNAITSGCTVALCGAAFDSATFGAVEGARNAAGADLVALIRNGGDFSGSGVAWIGSAAPPASFMYSVTTGCVLGCENVFIHELGHNMGNHHDRHTAAFQNGGVANTSLTGSHYGYVYCSSGLLSCDPNRTPGTGGCNTEPQCATPGGTNFSDIMAYFSQSTTRLHKFSNPNITCAAGGDTPRPCGLPGAADTALTMNTNSAGLSSLKPTIVSSAGLPGALQFTATLFDAAESAGTVTLSVARIGGSTGSVSVQYATASGTATSGADFTATTGTLSWSQGDAANKTIVVPIANDGVEESTESFTVTLSNPTGAAGVYLGHPTTATVVILSAFPVGGTLPAGWNSNATPTRVWSVATSPTYEGTHSLASAVVLDNTPDDGNFSTFANSDLSSGPITFVAGTVSFAYRVSAYHQNLAFLEFLIDNVVVFSTTNTDDGNAGTNDWRFASAPITAGSHTLTWRYRTSLPFPCANANPPPPSGAGCVGRAWIDAVALPLPAPFAPATPPKRLDLNGDSRSDILWRNTDGSSATWLMNGLTISGTSLFFGPGSGWTPTLAADFNGDSRSDIAWRHTDGSLAMWLMNGVTPTGTALLFGPGNGYGFSHAGDFNGDGKSDAVLTHTDGSIALWLLDGTTVTNAALLFGPGSGWSVRRVADFNGDGRSDLVLQNVDGSTAIWIMNGVAPTSTALLFGAGSGWSVTQTGDFNNDGRADIVWRHTDGSSAIWVMNGTSVVTTALLFGGGSGWEVAHTGDFNADGNSDLVWKHTDGSSAIWVLNANLSVASTALLFGGGSGWSVARLADFNGDGKSDLVWRNTDGSSALWLMDNLTVTSTALLFGPGSGWGTQPTP